MYSKGNSIVVCLFPFKRFVDMNHVCMNVKHRLYYKKMIEENLWFCYSAHLQNAVPTSLNQDIEYGPWAS